MGLLFAASLFLNGRIYLLSIKEAYKMYILKKWNMSRSSNPYHNFFGFSCLSVSVNGCIQESATLTMMMKMLHPINLRGHRNSFHFLCFLYVVYELRSLNLLWYAFMRIVCRDSKWRMGKCSKGDKLFRLTRKFCFNYKTISARKML